MCAHRVAADIGKKHSSNVVSGVIAGNNSFDQISNLDFVKCKRY